MCALIIGIMVQVVVEVHDTADRLQRIACILKTAGCLTATKQGFGPETYIIYARRP